MKRPNILYIHSHDTGRYIQPYGYAVPAPRLQRLAEEGVLFRRAHCCAPTCSPSRAALLTGQYPHVCGMLGLAHRGFSLNDYGHHIAHTLRAAGYRSALAGVQHVAVDADTIGYDQVLTLESNAPALAPIAGEFLSSRTGKGAQPFFLSVGFAQTHRAYPPPGSQEDVRWSRAPGPLPDTPETRRDMAAFKASVWQLDEGIGSVLDSLEASGLAQNTLVICTTDHGIAFPGMKCNLTDHGIGVMLIIRGPGGFAGGGVCDALVSHVDVFPTLCECLGIEAPGWLQGVSLMPLVRGEAQEVREEVFAEVTYHAAYEPQRAVRTRWWKYIRRFDERTRPVLPNCDDSPSKELWLAHGWRERSVASEQLYDLVFDPHEACSLVGEPAMASVLDEMRGRLDRWMRDTDDPLLKGPAPAPSGARVNDPDDLSPRDPTHLVT